MSKKTRYIHQIRSDTNDVTVILLAAGIGRRMKHYGAKSLLDYDEAKLIDHQLATIRQALPEAEIILVVGFKSQDIIDYVPDDVRIVENIRFEETNTVESLRLAINNSTRSNLLLIHGDMAFSKEAISFQGELENFMVIDKDKMIGNDKIGVVHEDDKVVNLSYGLPVKWGQIVYLNQLVYSDVKRLCVTMGDRSQVYELLNEMLRLGHEFKIHNHPEMVVKEIDSIKDTK